MEAGIIASTTCALVAYRKLSTRHLDIAVKCVCFAQHDQRCACCHTLSMLTMHSQHGVFVLC
jgi:hypothetical protein